MTPCSICVVVQQDPPAATHVRRVPAMQGEPTPVCGACAAEIESDHPHRPAKVHEKVLFVAGNRLAVGWLVWVDSAGTAAVCITSCPNEPALVGADRLVPLDRICSVRAAAREGT